MLEILKKGLGQDLVNSPSPIELVPTGVNGRIRRTKGLESSNGRLQKEHTCTKVNFRLEYSMDKESNISMILSNGRDGGQEDRTKARTSQVLAKHKPVAKMGRKLTWMVPRSRNDCIRLRPKTNVLHPLNKTTLTLECNGKILLSRNVQVLN